MKKIKRIKPEMPWQIGEFSRSLQLKIHLPYQFLLLCKLVNVTPRQMVIDFMNNLSCGSWNRRGRDKIRETLIEYFQLHGYGLEYFSEEQLKEIFKELNAQGLLYPHDCDDKTLEIHVAWRDEYYKFWFQKWFEKDNRKDGA